MIRMHRRISGAVTVLTMAALILTGCTSEASSISSAKNKTEGADVVDTGFTMSTVGSYDSADTAVVLFTDEANKAVTFINMDTGKQYTLYYDGTTYVKDKYDGPMTISQIEPGDVVDVTFLKGKKRLASIKLSPDAWVYDDVYNYDLAGANRTASIGSQSYSLPESVVVLSEGRRVDKAEVVSQDVVTISGIAHKIYSINVDKGHGYLSLKNEQPLLGGWIEVGNSMIRQIKEDMLLVVPEGTYQVVLNNNGIGCVKDVTIERDKEVVLDVDDIEIPEDATGKILFSVSPENATVTVDGKPVDISKVVELSYGIHRVEASASGYDTLTKHIQVGSEYATISFKLEETRKEDNSVSGNSITRDPWKESETEPVEETTVDDSEITAPESVSENALRSSKNGTAEVHVKDWTTGAELQGVTVRLEIEDSNKKITSTRSKTSPCSFSKEKDAHKYRFTLSMDGYETKSFEPDLEEYQKDETLYFMIKKQESSSSTNNNNTNSNTRISTNVISAIATAGTSCDLTNGPDENTGDAYVTSASLGNLWKSGKEKLSEAVKNAVQKVVGTEEIGSYYFKVEDNLKDVVALANGDYEGTASVMVSKNGYREETIPVRVVIKPKAEEPPSKGQVSFSGTEDIWIIEFTVDGQDISSMLGPIELDYGIHTVFIKAEGYEDFTKEFEVNSEELTVPCELVLEHPDEGDNDQNDTGNGGQSGTGNGDQNGTGNGGQSGTGNGDQNGTGNGGQSGTGNGDQNGTGNGGQSGTGNGDQNGTGNSGQSGTGSSDQNGTGNGGQSGTGNGDQNGTGNGDQGGADNGDQNGTGNESPNGTNHSDDVETQSFSITQQSHPIRDFFSSLFK